MRNTEKNSHVGESVMLISTQLLAFCMLSLVQEFRRGVSTLSSSTRSMLASAAEKVTFSVLRLTTPASMSA